MEEHHFGKLVAHAPYTMNVCAAKPDIQEFSWNILKDDMERMEYLPEIIIISIRVHMLVRGRRSHTGNC